MRKLLSTTAAKKGVKRLKKFAQRHWKKPLWLLALAFQLVWLVSVLRYGFTITVPFEKGSSWWSQLPWTAVAATIAALVTLHTLYTNKKTQEQLFERKSLFDEFGDILDRFSAPDKPFAKASAASRLADIAERRLPGKPSAPTPENYPFFRRAAIQLSTALHMEEDPKIQHHIVAALRQMARFGARQGQQLLKMLISELIAANLKAKDNFIAQLAEFYSFQEDPDTTVRSLVGFAPFCFQINEPHSMDITHCCLKNLASSEDFSQQVNKLVTLRTTQGCDRYTEPDETFLARFEIAANQLTASRDALADSLRELLPLEDLPAEFTTVTRIAANIVLDNSLDTVKTMFVARHGIMNLRNPKIKQLDLMGCFLAGAELAGVHLEASMLWMVHFEGADLGNASLQGAMLVRSHFQGGCLFGANLQGADLAGCDLQGTDLTKCNLKGANLGMIEVKGEVGKVVLEAEFSDADWWNSDFYFAHGSDRVMRAYWDVGIVDLLKWFLSTFPPPEGTPIPEKWTAYLEEEGHEGQQQEVDGRSDSAESKADGDGQGQDQRNGGTSEERQDPGK